VCVSGGEREEGEREGGEREGGGERQRKGNRETTFAFLCGPPDGTCWWR
jgi:hypothetical protein